jgi:AraC family transcriptional regulator
VDFVQAHLSQNLSLDALAQHTGYSTYHFARLFRSTLGESPHQYVLRQRVERAHELLKRPDLPLVEVALATGFAHQSHLTQQFKRHFGVTPSAYRREHASRMRASRPTRVRAL